MRRPPVIAARQCGVFSSFQAHADGWTSAALRHATSAGRLVRLRVGAYQVADFGELGDGLTEFERIRWRHAGPAVAAALTTPGALASHSTAAVLRGLPLTFVPERPCVSVVPWNTGDVPRVHLHRCTAEWFSLPVGEVSCTTVERTVLDLGREHGVGMAVAAMDHALHEGLTDLSALRAELRRMSRWPGVRAARAAVDSADGRSESPLESLSRLRFPEFGIPRPELQVKIGNGWGGFVARVDFYWDDFGVVGEVDGDLKYAGHDWAPLLREKRRQERLEELNLVVVRRSSADLRNFTAVANRLRRAFARGTARPAADRLWRVLADFDPAIDADSAARRP